MAKKRKLAKGQSLERNLSQIMQKLFTPNYWPNRSGVQHGYDAYAKFNLDGHEYLWKFECKDLHQKKHLANFDDVKEIEVEDFSDKVMQLMGMAEATYPHVFCLVIPHKRIGNNNGLRDYLASWNAYKHPFKIVIWDFDFLKDKIPFLHLPSADAIYPNATNKSKTRHDETVRVLKDEIADQSVDGFIRNRTYSYNTRSFGIADREVLCIIIKQIQPGHMLSSHDDISYVFEVKGQEFTFLWSELAKYGIFAYPFAKKPIDDVAVIAAPGFEISPPQSIEGEVFDKTEYQEIIGKCKEGLLELFKRQIDDGPSLFQKLKSFCDNRKNKAIYFIGDKDELLARLPLNELKAADFGADNNIHFRYRYSYE